MGEMKKLYQGWSWERFTFEMARAWKYFRRSPVSLVIVIQLAAFVFVSSKNAEKIYGDMVILLIGITVITCFLTIIARGNQLILLYTLLLVTAGTILQCIFAQESIAASGEEAVSNPALSLQLHYIVSLCAALMAAFIYRKCSFLSEMKWCRRFVILSIGISAFTLVVAQAVGGVKNWISIGGSSVQTTEFVKLLYILVVSALLGTKEAPSKRRVQVFYLFTGVNLLFLVLQSEFGTLLLLLFVFLVYHFLFVPDLKLLLKTLAIFAAMVAAAVLLGIFLTKMQAQDNILGTNPISAFYLRNYNKIANRFVFWKDPMKDPQGLGYQLIQARNSILLGGWLGTSSVTDLPVKTSDLVYPAMIQRCGMIFGVLVFIIFILNWSEGLRVFIRKKDRYHCAIAAGIVFMFFIQALIIIGGSTGLCPLTGITLPFISSGGSSLLVSSIMVGLLVAVSGNVQWEGRNNHEDEFFKKGPVLTKCCAGVRHIYDSWNHRDVGHRAGDLQGSGRKKRSGKAKHLPKGIRKGKHSR